MTNNPVLTLFDRDFLLYAGNDILSKTIVAFMGIWMACTLFDLVTDKDTRPSKRHLLVRGMLAFFVPFTIILTTAQASAMPSSYRVYESGSYEIGKSLPAGTYAVSAGRSGSSLTIEGEDGKTSQKWNSGTMSVTVYDGDTLTLDGCSARNRTASLTYNAGASTGTIANGSLFLLGGADLCPGTYELTALGDTSEYEVRDGYLKAGDPLDPEGIEGIAYADVHYGEVLYVRDASVVLYSNVFALPKASDETDEATDDGTAETRDGEKKEATDPAGKEDEAKDEKPEGEPQDQQDKGEKPQPEDEGQSEDAPSKDGKGETASDVIDKVNQTPWTRGEYTAEHDADSTGTDAGEGTGTTDVDAEPDQQGPSFHDAIRRLMI